LSCTTCPNPIATPTDTTEYCVTAFTVNGCSDTACVQVVVLRACEVFVPNAFSPNASGRNDQQCVYGDCISSMVFRIYDRLGNRVFETTDAKICWDGLHNGEPLNPGVFVYVLNATLTSGETVERQGNITLVR
jgi:gliding motility-associated-like protein